MGEAKRRRKLDKHITVCDDAGEAMQRLGAEKAGTPLSVALLGAGLIAQAARAGLLEAKLLAKEATTERHLYRLRVRDLGSHPHWRA
jgi:hypothetical protein